MITDDDNALINLVLKKMTDAWSAGDGAAYASVFMQDARYIEAPGFRARGAKLIGERHQAIFDGIFKNTRINGDYPKSIQPLTSNVVIFHSEGNVLFPGETGKNLQPNGIISICLLKTGGEWKIASFQNTPTGKFRGVKFFIRFLRSRLYLLTNKHPGVEGELKAVDSAPLKKPAGGYRAGFMRICVLKLFRLFY